MYNDEPAGRQFYAVAAKYDQPNIQRGLLIPGQVVVAPRQPGFLQSVAALERPFVLMLASVLLFALSLGSAGYAVFQGGQLQAAPIVYVASSNQYEFQPLNYGVHVALSQPDFFAETLESFLDNDASFIEADLSTMEIRYYEKGQVIFEAPIVSKGKEGSWWETPAGLYKVELKSQNHFSSFGQVYQPWSMVFQGNFFIHGWPYYPDGRPVPEGFSGGCIRLATPDAEALYKLVKTDTPVLVHEKKFATDNFLYEPKIPELETPHYLIADIKSSTVLAASDLEEVVPIASITKLMTALVAAEYINLDKRASVSQQSLVRSIIPRLRSGNTASMYSLMQLLLVESSNEAAEVIAAQIGRERFIELMNKKADSLGLTNTTFADPSGLSANNVSSVGDLLRLLQYIYNNRSFIIELTANQNLPTAYIGGEFGELINYNQIEGLDNFIGGKVGETLAAGQTSVSLHTMQVNSAERIVAVIILGSKDRNADVLQLLTYMQDRFGD